MSRIAKYPITLPSGVECELSERELAFKGSKGRLSMRVHDLVQVTQEDGALRFAPKDASAPEAWSLTGTARASANNLVRGVSEGFERRLQLVGVGYRAQKSEQSLSLNVGFSHVVDYPLPEDIEIETPQPTEIVVRGIDKQRVGQVAAKIRGFRPPEPYKGKGIRYADEQVKRKEAKKK